MVAMAMENNGPDELVLTEEIQQLLQTIRDEIVSGIGVGILFEKSKKGLI
jgi:hypothetical protein